ncbi:hypothetical protein K438DRAFT_1783221 [Mycena galopus ATCC 62051]|nr:hypothetical protein K438DRAFT_1783221 [Mycena galopus ATCC 62051]
MHFTLKAFISLASLLTLVQSCGTSDIQLLLVRSVETVEPQISNFFSSDVQLLLVRSVEVVEAQDDTSGLSLKSIVSTNHEKGGEVSMGDARSKMDSEVHKMAEEIKQVTNNSPIVPILHQLVVRRFQGPRAVRGKIVLGRENNGAHGKRATVRARREGRRQAGRTNGFDRAQGGYNISLAPGRHPFEVFSVADACRIFSWEQ